jgi:hypothetical protein
VTRDRARKKSVRAQMAASGEPYSVAARNLGQAGAAGETAQAEVMTQLEATLAAASARIEVSKELTTGLASAPDRDRHRHGPFSGLAGTAVTGAWNHAVPGKARARLRTAFRGIAVGIVEPSARRFQYYMVAQDHSMPGLLTAFGLGLDPAPDVDDVSGVDPLELLTSLRPLTAARYAGEETVGEALCRKFAVTTDGTPAALTVWADGEHVRQIQTVTAKKAKRIGVTVAATSTVTAQLWDFGVPADSADWPPASALRRRAQIHPAAAAGPGDSRLSDRPGEHESGVAS